MKEEMVKNNDGMTKIVLTFWDSNSQPTINKSFDGMWLIDKGYALGADDESQNWDVKARWAAAKTAKNNIVLYITHTNEEWGPKQEVYGSIAEMAGNVPKNVIAEIASALGEGYAIEMDI